MTRRSRKIEIARTGADYEIMLDGRPLLSPARHRLIIGSQALAEAVAAEWAAQGARVEPASMLMMSFCATAVDRLAGQRNHVVSAVVAYVHSDLLCYRASGPGDLVCRQQETWQPLLDWCANRFEARFRLTTSIMPAQQPVETVDAVRRAVLRYGDFSLTGLHELTTGFGSVVIALAVLESKITIDAGIAAALLHETYQLERWGDDAEALARRAGLIRDMRSAATFVALC